MVLVSFLINANRYYEEDYEEDVNQPEFINWPQFLLVDNNMNNTPQITWTKVFKLPRSLILLTVLNA